MIDQIKTSLQRIIADEFGQDLTPLIERTDEQFGDLTTNVAMQLAGALGKNPRDIASQICHRLMSAEDIESAEVAGPGFVNIRLKDSVLINQCQNNDVLSKIYEGQTITCEYSDPNPFKVLHAGHLYTTLVGDAVSRIIEHAGAKVIRLNFGGDVGLHVAKAMWAILNEINNNPAKLTDVNPVDRPKWISDLYVKGNSAYESDQAAKDQIIEINKKIYQLHTDNDQTSDFAQIYWTCRKWSYDGFKKLYEDLEVKAFDKFYPESETSADGLKLSQQALADSVLKQSDGAVIYPGDDNGLHNRVFINSAGLPTYEAKDLGLNKSKITEYNPDKNIIITANDINEYMKVVLRVAAHFYPGIEAKTIHLTHGVVKLPGGQKMSSRTGSVVLADDILQAAYEASDTKDRQVVLGAVRYSFLKNRLGGDIVYDPAESVAHEGNSGPYLQYALVRARSILRKIDLQGYYLQQGVSLQEHERRLALKLTQMPEVFAESAKDFSPHHICNYLYELAGTFNRFYENSRVIGDERADLRANLVAQYEKTLAKGLEILGMPTPEEM